MHRYLLTFITVLFFTAQAHAAAVIGPAFSHWSSASGGVVDASKQGTNTMIVQGATFSKPGGKPTMTMTGDGLVLTPLLVNTQDIITLGPWVDARAYASLAVADAAAVSAGKLLIISSQWDTVPSTLNANTRMLPGGKLNGSGTVTITGDFQGATNCIGSSMTVAGLKEARPEWWATNTSPGTTDMAAAIRAAATAVAAQRGILRFSATSYGIGSTVAIGRIKVAGLGDGSKLVPLMTDGTPVLDVTAGTNFFSLEDFVVDSGLNQANYLTGAVSGQVATGLRINASGSTYAARFHMKNIRIYGMAVGADIKGFIGSIEGITFYNCDLGLRGTTMNGVRINPRFENCRKDMEITASDTIHIDSMETEGGVNQYGLASSTFDGIDGLRFTSARFEQSRNVPFVTIGGTTLCTNVIMDGIKVAVANDASNNYDIYPIALDQVDGYLIQGMFSTGYHHNRYSTTVNSKNPFDFSGAIGNNWGPHDASLNLSRALNLFPNSNLDLGLRGWDSITFARCTGSIENTIVRRGTNAVRLTATAGQTNNYWQVSITDTAYATALRGKTVTLYAWVWIPNLSVFAPGSSMPFQPTLTIVSTNAVPASTTGTTGTQHTQRGAWNLMKVTHTLQSDATRVDFNFYMNNGGGNAAGTEYIVVGAAYLIEGNGGQDIAVRNGWISDSDLNPTRGIGGKLIQKVTSVPTDVDMNYEVGDRFEYRAPTPGGYSGVVVTTAGTGATMVTKGFGAIAP